MNFPADLKYTKDHEWVKIDGSTATVGITEFAQRELGDIVYVDISSVGKEVAKEEVFGTVEAVKTVSDLFMPIIGLVLPAGDWRGLQLVLDHGPDGKVGNAIKYGDLLGRFVDFVIVAFG